MKINQAISADQLDEYLDEEQRIQDFLGEIETALREGRPVVADFRNARLSWVSYTGAFSRRSPVTSSPTGTKMKINREMSADQLDEYLDEEQRIQDFLGEIETALRESRPVCVDSRRARHS